MWAIRPSPTNNHFTSSQSENFMAPLGVPTGSKQNCTLRPLYHTIVWLVLLMNLAVPTKTHCTELIVDHFARHNLLWNFNDIFLHCLHERIMTSGVVQVIHMQPALVGLEHHIRVALGLPMDDESIPVISDIIFTLDQRKGEYVGHRVPRKPRLPLESFKISNFIEREFTAITFQYHLLACFPNIINKIGIAHNVH